MTLQLTITTSSEEQTDQLGRQLAPILRAGDLIYISAPMGSGKTVLVRGLVRELSGADIDVPSPTFMLVQHYDTQPAVTHADLYRLEAPEELLEVGLEEAAEQRIVIVEWPEKGAGYLSDDALQIRGEIEGNIRQWHFHGDAHWEERLKLLGKN